MIKQSRSFISSSVIVFLHGSSHASSSFFTRSDGFITTYMEKAARASFLHSLTWTKMYTHRRPNRFFQKLFSFSLSTHSDESHCKLGRKKKGSGESDSGENHGSLHECLLRRQGLILSFREKGPFGNCLFACKSLSISDRLHTSYISADRDLASFYLSIIPFPCEK